MSWSLQIPPTDADSVSDVLDALVEGNKESLENQNPGCEEQVAAVVQAAIDTINDGGSGLTGMVAGYVGGHYSQPDNEVPNSVSFNLYQVKS